MKRINDIINGLKAKINAYWDNAREDYGINGHLIDITAFNYTRDDITAIIEWVEEGTTYSLPLHFITDHTAESLYNIWMETDWSFFASETELV